MLPFVTPMGLQVVFMQESNVAKETKRSQDFQKNQKSRKAKDWVSRNKMLDVDEIDETDSRKVEDDGGGDGSFVPSQRRGPDEGEEDDDDESSPAGPQEEGKGDVLDMQA